MIFGSSTEWRIDALSVRLRKCESHVEAIYIELTKERPKTSYIGKGIGGVPTLTVILQLGTSNLNMLNIKGLHNCNK